MTGTVEVEPGVFVPLKCGDHDAAGVPPNPCREPGSMLRCQLCPNSPSYWRRQERSVTRG